MGENADLYDPWRRRMSVCAQRLRLLDEARFKDQIARIEETLRRDAEWNLESALQCYERCVIANSPSLRSRSIA